MTYEGSAPDIGAFEYGFANAVMPAACSSPRNEPVRVIGLYNLQGKKTGGTRVRGSDRAGIYFAITRQGNRTIVKRIMKMK
jgi:hypothetical protein